MLLTITATAALAAVASVTTSTALSKPLQQPVLVR